MAVDEQIIVRCEPGELVDSIDELRELVALCHATALTDQVLNKPSINYIEISTTNSRGNVLTIELGPNNVMRDFIETLYSKSLINSVWIDGDWKSRK